jgi:heme-degrading monooxygenase HmoA
MNLVTSPPPDEAIAAMKAIDGVRIVPVMLNTQSGPESHLGPESTGAILILQGTFAQTDRFNEFWTNVVGLMELLATAPGFIRRYNFADGPHYTLMAWWRSVEDAHTFFAGPEHQAAMRKTFERRWNYTHFAGLWQASSPRQRLFFCQTCDGITPSTESHCTWCGSPLRDTDGGAHVPATAHVLDEWIPVQHRTGIDMHSGNTATWANAWSHQNPVTVFGAGVRARTGWDDVHRTITRMTESVRQLRHL